MEGEEAAEDIQAAARAAGYSVTLSQLRRWHRAQVIGAPRQQALGRGQGTATFYPQGTAERALAICRIEQRHRRLQDVAWTLWWDGYDVADSVIRKQLEAEATVFGTVFERFVGPDGATEEAEDFLDRAHEARIPSRPLRWARRRVGAGSFDTFLGSLFAVMAGRARDLSDEAIAQLDHGLGFDIGRTMPLATGEPWISGDARSDFVSIGQLFNPERIRSGLILSDAELRIARQEARDFLSVVRTMGHLVREGFGRWHFGFGVIGAVMDEVGGEPAGQRRFLLLWLSMRTPEFIEGMRSIAGQAPEMASANAQLELIRELINSVPAVGEALSIEEVIQARFDYAKQIGLHERIRELRAQHGEEIDKFIELRNA